MTAGLVPGEGFHSVVYIGMGSNLDNPDRQVRLALEEIGAMAGSALVRCSSLYETAPIGGGDQPAFINAVAELDTTLSPRMLMQELLGIEQCHNRIRAEKNGPRTLDLDILIFNDWRISTKAVTIPHPRAHKRAFVLLPLLEIAPDLYIPGRGYARDFLPDVSGQQIHKLQEAIA